MELFAEAKGYASIKTATDKLAKVLPDYKAFRYFFVALPNGRFLPVVQVAGTDREGLVQLAHHGVGVI